MIGIAIDLPEDLRGQLWLHFTETNAAQSTFCRGSSIALSGDAIAGLTLGSREYV